MHDKPDKVELLQALLDLCECWLIFDTARREVSQHSGWVALTLAMLCPFTAGYAASGMTESLSIGCVALAIWLFCRRNKLQLLPVADMIAVVTPIGLVFGRLANFING